MSELDHSRNPRRQTQKYDSIIDQPHQSALARSLDNFFVAADSLLQLQLVGHGIPQEAFRK